MNGKRIGSFRRCNLNAKRKMGRCEKTVHVTSIFVSARHIQKLNEALEMISEHELIANYSKI